MSKNLVDILHVGGQLMVALGERCGADQWSADARACFAYAKTRDDLDACAGKLTPEQHDKLLHEIADVTGEPAQGSAPPSGGGWADLIAASPLETDPIKLCGPIDPPAGTRTPNSANISTVFACYKSVEDQAFDFQNRARAGRSPLSDLRDKAVADCLAAVQGRPYIYTSFDSQRACAAYDAWIKTAEVSLKGEGLAGDPRLQQDLQQNQAQRAVCVRDANVAATASRKTRAANAATVGLAVLRDIPPAERTPEEAARLTREIAACKAEAIQRRQDRLAIAATRDIDQLRAIAPEYRLPEEQQRVAEADAARAALIAQRQKDPKWAGPVLSAAICIASDRKAGAAKEIQTEYAYAKQYGGIIDQSKIYDLQQQIRAQDDVIAETRRLMGQLRAPVQSCQAKLVKQLAGCLSPPDGAAVDPACGTKPIREYLELASPP